MNRLLFCLLLSLGLPSLASASFNWNLNDVSFLLPLPDQAGSDSLLRLNDQGAKGNILPKLWVDRIPPLVMTAGRDEMDAALRVVSIRIDPCFVTLAPERCEKQIRFVWQPIVQDSRPFAVTEDAALHSFYILTDEEFVLLRQDLQSWKVRWNVQTDGLPVQVLPVLQNPKQDNPALKDLLSVFLKYTGQQNLLRFTAMVLRGGDDMWVFMQFDMVEGKPVAQPIPRLEGHLTQAFVNQVNPATEFGRVAVSPMPAGPDALSLMISPSAQLLPEQDPLLLQEMEVLSRIENPKNFHANNMDCVSCHVAEPAKRWMERSHGHLDLKNVLFYANPRHNLQNTTSVLWSTHMVRAFGYFGRFPAISQRLINESADVADQLNDLDAAQ